MPTDLRAPTRRRRCKSCRQTRVEDRCVVCGEWVPRTGNRPRVTCGPSHKTTLSRWRAAGRVPPFAV